MKTNQLFKKYYRILNEQEPAVPPTEAPAADQPVAATPEPETPQLQANEKYVIKILTNAFIFNPKLFDSNKRNFIANKIEDIKRMINVPVARVVEEIKSVLNLDHSLRIESKTLSLIAKYLLIIEQPADATEPQANNNTPTDQPTDAADSTSNTSNDLNLAEIFPLYKELILQSLSHSPTEEELMILKPIVNEFADSDPEKIVITIKDLLNQESDRDLETNLANA